MNQREALNLDQLQKEQGAYAERRNNGKEKRAIFA